MDFGDQIGRVYDRLRDAPREFISLPEVKAWLNEAQEDLCIRQEVLRDESSAVVASEQTLVIPPDCIRVINVRFPAVGWGTNVEPVNDDEYWRQIRDGYSDPVGGPFWRPWGGVIEVYPRPAVGEAYTIEYVKLAEELVDDADVSPLPIDLQRKMIWYALVHAYTRLNEDAQATAYEQRYERGLLPVPNGRSMQNPGPRTLTFARGPFDTPDAAHRG